jgi:hypothetical protein
MRVKRKYYKKILFYSVLLEKILRLLYLLRGGATDRNWDECHAHNLMLMTRFVKRK